MEIFTKRLQHIRQNHALEHATINILNQTGNTRSLAGYSDSRGFWVFGDVSIEDLQQSIDQAMSRLKAGEHTLAIHPHCGTNYAVTGLLAGTGAWLSLLGTDGLRKKLDRLPLVILLVTIIHILSQPLGPLVQEKYTTATPGPQFRIESIYQQKNKDTVTHRVFTRQA